MKTYRARSILMTAISASVLLVGQLGGAAFAAAAKTSSPATGNPNGLKLSPLRSDITVNKGSTGSVKVVVTNVTKMTVTLKSVENDFVAGDEKGTPAIILDENSYAPSHSLKRFMVPAPSVTLAPGQSQEVNVVVRVPATAQAGGYFGALRFAPAGLSGGAVNIGASVASLILLTVPGPAVEQMLLTNFDVQQNGGTSTNFRTPDSLSLFLRFQNKGNLQEAPFGQVYVLKGKKTVYSSNFNQEDPRNEILPDSARQWQLPLKNLGKFGKYTVAGTFGYGAKGQTINIQKTVWIVPTTYIFGVIGGVLLLILVIGGSYLFLRNYKRKILQSSRRRY